MTLPSDDDRLVAFLRRHRPDPPPASPDLEQQLMTALEPAGRPARSQRRDRRRPWAMPALAASLLLAWASWGTLRTSTQPTTAEAEAETFVTEVWYGTAYGDDTVQLALATPQPDWLLTAYANPY
jgi:hypothetical protein